MCRFDSCQVHHTTKPTLAVGFVRQAEALMFFKSVNFLLFHHPLALTEMKFEFENVSAGFLDDNDATHLLLGTPSLDYGTTYDVIDGWDLLIRFSFEIEEKTDTEWKDAEFVEEEIFHMYGILLKPQSTENKTYITEHYDLSKAGTYRILLPFSVKDGDSYKQYKTWTVFNVGEVLSSQSLKEKYPQFFNVSTDGGLTVCIWQMAANNYNCYLANTSMEAISDNSFAYEVGASIAEMRTILTTYEIEQKDITIHPVRNPLSSYYYEIDDAYRTGVKELFWNTMVN